MDDLNDRLKGLTRSDDKIPAGWMVHEHSRYVGEDVARLERLAQAAKKQGETPDAGEGLVDLATYVTMRAAVIDDAMDMLEGHSALGHDELCDGCRGKTALDYCRGCLERLWIFGQRERWKRVAVRKAKDGLDRASVAANGPGQAVPEGVRELLVDVLERLRQYEEMDRQEVIRLTAAPLSEERTP